MKEYKIPAIVFGGGINGLGIVRNLGREGVPVFCVCESVDPTFFSKYCLKRFLVHSFEDEAKSILEKLSKLSTTRPIVFSTSDMINLFLSNMQSELRDDFEFVLPEREVVSRLVMKRQFYRFLVENRIPHPHVIVPSDVSDTNRVEEELGYPVFVRPSISPIFAHIFHKKGFLAYSSKELVRDYQVACEHNIEVIFQEIVPGVDDRMYGISGVLDKNSKPVAFFAYHRLRGWPRVFGNSSLMESIGLDKIQLAKQIVTECLSKLKYNGIMDAELKLDPRDGMFKLLEINARSWWQNSFPTRCGLNIIMRAYLDAIGQNLEYSQDYLEGAKWINLFDDFRSSLVGKDFLTKKWLMSLEGVRDFAFFDVHDLGPPVTSIFCEVAGSVLH